MIRKSPGELDRSRGTPTESQNAGLGNFQMVEELGRRLGLGFRRGTGGKRCAEVAGTRWREDFKTRILQKSAKCEGLVVATRSGMEDQNRLARATHREFHFAGGEFHHLRAGCQIEHLAGAPGLKPRLITTDAKEREHGNQK